MFFEESVNIREAIQRVSKEIFPLMRKKFSELEQKNTELLKANLTLAFSFNRLKKEFEGLSKKFELIWVPAVVKCLETSDCQKPFNGFTIIRASHVRQRKGLLELRNMCDAYVMEESGVCFIPKELFMGVLQRDGVLSMEMMKLLSSDLKHAEVSVTHLAQKPVRERLAEALLFMKETYGYQSDGITIDLRITREEIANLVGTATETAIRLLSEMKNEKVVGLEG